MASSDVQRKLTAILVSDVVGYSRLMGDDPEGTLTTLTTYRQVFSDKIKEYKGRVVNAPGDSLLAEFGSVLDAVSCAAEIQRELAERNEELPDTRRMDFRIGVTLGDVLVKQKALYGDGVNIAARLESLAEPGGICISDKAHTEVENRLPLHFEYFGEQQVKNIEQPVRVSRVLSKPGAAAHRVVRASRLGERKGKLIGLAASAVIVALLVAGGFYFTRPAEESAETVAEKGLSLPDRPSIAVLPFVNISGDPEQEYFADGITENIITDLSQLRDLMVIARNSVFTYKGKSVDVRQVSRELGVRHVLEGSVQKAGDRVRITAQLVDAVTAEHIWAARWDRPMKDIFDLQDEITRNVVDSLEVTLTEGEDAVLWRRSTHSPRAYELFLKARSLQLIFTKESVLQARTLYKEALALDPDFVIAIVWLGWSHWLEIPNGWSADIKASIRRSEELARQAIAVDPNSSDGYGLLGAINLAMERHDDAVRSLERSLALAPGNASPHALLAALLPLVEEPVPQRALSLAKKAIRLNPNPPSWYWTSLASTSYMSGDLDGAEAAARKCLSISQFASCYKWLLLTLMERGELEIAKVTAHEFKNAHPQYRADADRFMYKNKETALRHEDLLHQAGIE